MGLNITGVKFHSLYSKIKELIFCNRLWYKYSFKVLLPQFYCKDIWLPIEIIGANKNQYT